MKQILLKQGAPIVEIVPAPLVEPGTILVRTAVSCISVGTELSGIKMSGTPLWKKALAQPQKVRQALDMVADKGLTRTIAEIKGKAETPQPVGYSAAGTVIAVGGGVCHFAVGDRVAVAGAQCAFHAEVLRVPVNLAVAIPDGVAFDAASTVALGAIALQGIRRAKPTLGESFVVVGLGLLGQLTVQMLRANGVKAMALDPDAGRLAQAVAAGALGLDSQQTAEAQVARLTGGVGADGVIVTAATVSDEVISIAFKMCRKKARVVLVGDVGLDLDRNDIYVKELDFLVSTSYGPGRYDARYEEEGLDYPISQVRWTENRNMAAYLDLVAAGAISLDGYLDTRFAVDDAPRAYETLKSEARPMLALLEYPGSAAIFAHSLNLSPCATSCAGAIRIAVVGAGEFAVAMHLPLIQAMPDQYQLRAIVNRTGHKAASIAKRFGADVAATDFEAILSDPDIDAVLLCTRHNLHASQTLAALMAGKHVLVEKPLALNRQELAAITAFLEGTGERAPVLLCGFNRRFSPYMAPLADGLKSRSNPLIVNYRMNAGHIPSDHWVHGPEGGGRNIGEACHIYDLFTFLTDARVTSVDSRAIAPATGFYRADDNFIATIGFSDGSVAGLTYTALGNTKVSKEKMELYCDGAVYEVDDFKALSVTGRPGGFSSKTAEKGHREELKAFAAAIRHGEQAVPLWQTFQAMEIAFAVEGAIKGTQ
ncbi:MAG: bi-domain-containing oxidoreductase [Rhizobiales bacterium]|nr:bi-domain-containing oxidoreductase [Hyphomicrobiales bacterium]